MFFLLANEIAFNPEFPCQGTEKRCWNQILDRH
jgi:hypothetical protein